MSRRNIEQRLKVSVQPNQEMNQAEFLNIVVPFKDKIFRLAKRLLISTEEAEDETQEVLIKLWKNKEQIQN